jgi:membrane-bound metal-dependent hydrolase YbcI (DUF457 family)
MPGYRGHVVGGLATFGVLRLLIASYNPTLLTSVEWALFALLGALLPDIDIKSRGQNIFYVALAGAYAGALVAGHLSWSPFFVVAALFPMLVTHRGISHRWWFAVLFSCSVGFGLSVTFPFYVQAAWFNALFLCAGMLSHSILDRWLSQ